MTVKVVNVGSRSSMIAIWTLRVLLAALFLLTASVKFLGASDMVAEFNVIGLGQWFRLFTATVELAGAILVLWPAFSVFGALVLVCVCVGAFLTQFFVLHGDVLHTIVIGMFAAAAVYFQRGQLALAGI